MHSFQFIINILFIFGLLIHGTYEFADKKGKNDFNNNNGHRDSLNSLREADNDAPPPPPQDPFPQVDIAGFKSSVYDVLGSAVDNEIESRRDEKAKLEFHPPELQYHKTPVCIPAISSFTITNNLNIDVELKSIVSNSSQFYPVMFNPQKILAHSVTSIDILFLPHNSSPVDSTLIISTSLGKFEYKVIADSSVNPYKLNPIVDYEIPSGVPFEHPLTIYNPHNDTLRITEMYTTEEFVSLKGSNGDLKQGLAANEANNWEIESHMERMIIRLSMSSLAPGKYIGYVHVKTDHDNFVIPVSIVVLEGAVYSVHRSIDFGTITKANKQPEADLILKNSGIQPVKVTMVAPVNTDDRLVIKFVNDERILPAGKETKLATLSYSVDDIAGKFSNKLLIVTNHSNIALATFEIPYSISIIQGGITANVLESTFFLSVVNNTALLKKNPVPPRLKYSKPPDEFDSLKSVTLTNYFAVPLTIQNILSVDCPQIFQIKKLPSSLEANSYSSWPPLVISFNQSAALVKLFEGIAHQAFTCHLGVQTKLNHNIEVPLHVTTGTIDMFAVDEKTEALRTVSNPSNFMQNGVPNFDKVHEEENFDIIMYDLGDMATKSSRPIKLHVVNHNMYAIPLYLSNMSVPFRMCWREQYSIRDAAPTSNDDYIPSTRVDSDMILSPVDKWQSFSSCFSYDIFTLPMESMKYIFDIDAKSRRDIYVYVQDLKESFSLFVMTFGTPYQAKTLIFRYHGVSGTLRNSFNKTQTTFTFGIRSTIDIRTYSTFEKPVKLTNVYSNSYPMEVYFHENAGQSETNSSNKHEGYLTAHVRPSWLICLSSFNDHINQKFQKVGNFTSCLLNLLDIYHQEKVVFTKGTQIVDNLQNFTFALKRLEQLYGQPETMANELLSFQKNWFSTFPNGLPLPTFDVTFTASVTQTSLTIPNAFVNVPFTTGSHLHHYELPAIQYGQVVLVYLSIVNPFDTLVKFNIATANLGTSTLPLKEIDVLKEDMHKNGLKQIVTESPCALLECLNQTQTRQIEHSAVQYVVLRSHFVNDGRFSSDHPSFSLLASESLKPTSIYLRPHQTELFGPILFVPKADVHHYNTTIYITNNFTGVDRIEIVAQSGKVELEPYNIQMYVAETEDNPIEIFPTIERMREDQSYSISVSLNASHYLLSLSFVNLGKIEAVINDVVINGKRMCASSSLSSIWSSFNELLGRGIKTSIFFDQCEQFPLRMKFEEGGFFQFLGDMRCLLHQDVHHIELYSSAQAQKLIHIYLHLDMSKELLASCKSNKFKSFFAILTVISLIGVALILLLAMELFDVNKSLNKKKQRKPPSSSSSTSETRTQKTRNVKQGSDAAPTLPPNVMICKSNNSRSYRSDFQYLRKGVALDDIPVPALNDSSEIKLDAVAQLMKKRSNKKDLSVEQPSIPPQPTVTPAVSKVQSQIQKQSDSPVLTTKPQSETKPLSEAPKKDHFEHKKPNNIGKKSHGSTNKQPEAEPPTIETSKPSPNVSQSNTPSKKLPSHALKTQPHTSPLLNSSPNHQLSQTPTPTKVVGKMSPSVNQVKSPAVQKSPVGYERVLNVSENQPSVNYNPNELPQLPPPVPSRSRSSSMQKGLETMVNGILGSDSLDGSMSSGYFEHVASSNDSNFSYHQQAATLLSDLQWAGAGKTAIPPNRSKPVVNNGIHFDSSSSFFSIQPVAPPGFESSNNGSQIGDHMIPPGLGFTMTDNWLSYDFTQRTQPATNSHHVGRVNSPPVSDTWSSLFTMPFDDMNDTTQYDPFGGNQSYPNLSFPASGLDGINQSSNRMTGRDVFGASRNFTSETLITQSHTEHTILSTSASIKPAAVQAPALGGNRHGAGFFDTGQFFGDLNLNDDKQNSLLGSLED